MTPTGQECVCLWIFKDELLCNHMVASLPVSTHSKLTTHCIPNSHDQFVPKISACNEKIQWHLNTIFFYVYIHSNVKTKYNIIICTIKTYHKIHTYIL
jgi:hypothetical protein